MELYNKEQVIEILDELLNRPDILLDAIQNENTDWSAELLFKEFTTQTNN